MKYSQTAKSYLKENNQAEMNRLQTEGKEKEFLQDVDQVFGDQEETIMRQMLRKQDETTDPIRAAKQANMARMIAREQTGHDLGEFLKNL